MQGNVHDIQNALKDKRVFQDTFRGAFLQRNLINCIIAKRRDVSNTENRKRFHVYLLLFVCSVVSAA